VEQCLRNFKEAAQPNTYCTVSENNVWRRDRHGRPSCLRIEEARCLLVEAITMGILSRPSTWFSSEPGPVSVDSAQNGPTRKGQHTSDAVELGGRGRNGDLVNTRIVQRDRHGVALSPQPSDDPLDPLNWKPWLKFMVLAQVSLLAFLSLLSAALIVSPGSSPQRRSGRD
jgi:hypothetical protein